jgi:hypothetical protein
LNVLTALGSKVENWRGILDKKFSKRLEAEGINYDSRKVWVDFSANNIRGKGVYVSGAKQIARGRLIITEKGLVAIVGGYKLVDIPKNHPLFKEIVFDNSNPERTTIEVELNNFPAGFSGLITMKYHTPPENVKEWI